MASQRFDRDRRVVTVIILSGISLAVIIDVLATLGMVQPAVTFLIDLFAILGVVVPPVWIAIRYHSAGQPVRILLLALALIFAFMAMQLQSVRSYVSAATGFSPSSVQNLLVDAPIEVGFGLIILALVSLFITTSQKTAAANRYAADLSRAHDELFHAQRLATIGTLAAAIAHEVNNPLWMIGLQTEVAMRAANDDDRNEEVTNSLETIQSLVERGGRIVTNILHFSKQQQTEKKLGDLSAVVQDACRIAEEKARPERITIDFAAEDDLPRIVMNPIELQQACVNMLFNAIEASDSDSDIRIRLSNKEDSVELTIADKGEGMREEQIAEAFTPFYTTRYDAGGTGLGLSITKSIFDRHRATIDIVSELGHGTTIRVLLPTSLLGDNESSDGEGIDR